MIHILSMVPNIEKIVRGEVDEDQHFHSGQTTYRLYNIGVQISRYLEMYNIDHQIYGMVGKQALMVSDENLYAVQMDIQNGMLISLYQEEELWQQMKEPSSVIKSDQFQLYKSIVKANLKEGDVVVFADELETLPIDQMQNIYQALRNKAKISIWALSPKYLSMLKHSPCNVLVQDIQSLKNYFKIKEEMNLMDMVSLVQRELLTLSKIVILSIHSNRILIFINDEVYSANYKVSDPKDSTYYAAIISGVLHCHNQDGDMTCLLEEVLSLSVGASLSSDLYIPEKKVIRVIKDKLVISKLIYKEEL